MSDILSAHDLRPYKEIKTDHEDKFSNFWCLWVGQSWPSHLSWINRDMQFRWGDDLTMFPAIADRSNARWQLVSQVDHGPVLSKQYFVSAALCDEVESAEFKEVNESEIAALGLQKSKSFKNFKSRSENCFYEMNMYGTNIESNRRVQVNSARPEEIDL
jgi:hypothetical protein